MLRRTSGGLTGNRLGQAGSSKRIWSPATSVGGASSWWSRQRTCMTCVTFSGTRTSRRPRGTCGVRSCDWLKRWNGWKRQQASLTMPMSGINWRQCAEVFGKRAHKGHKRTCDRRCVKSYQPDPLVFKGKSGEPPRNRTGNLQIKSLLQSGIRSGHTASLRTKMCRRGQENAAETRNVPQSATHLRRSTPHLTLDPLPTSGRIGSYITSSQLR